MKSKKGLFGLKSWMMGIIAAVVFSFFMFGFMTNFIQTTNPTSPILSGESSSYLINSTNSMNRTITLLTKAANDAQNKSLSSQPENNPLFSIFLIFRAAFDIPLVLIQFVFNAIPALAHVLFAGLGSNTGLSIVITTAVAVIFSGLIITVVLLFIRFVRTGQE